MRNYKARYREAKALLQESIDTAKELKKENDDLQSKLKMEICKYQRQVSQHEESVRLLDSYMQTNARQAQDIIELESVAIALYDSLWHIVYSVEDEIQAKEVIETNAYKTVKALFEAEGEE